MRHLDLCSGIGGFALAASWHGCDAAGFVEIDPFCQRVLAKNFPGVPIASDVFEVSGDEFGPIDVLTAGIPCQPYSVAGKRAGNDDHRALWPEVARIIERCRPAFVIIENVPGFIGLALDGVWTDLESMAYEVGAVVLPACAVGAPHRRDRLWVMAYSASIAERKSTDEAVAVAIGRDARPESRSGGQPAFDTDAASERFRCGTASKQSRLDARICETLSDAASDIRETPRNVRPVSPDGGRQEISGIQTIADVDGARWQEQRRTVSDGAKYDSAECDRWRNAESGLGLPADGLSRRLDVGFARKWDNDDWESGVERTAGKTDDRERKLTALGNAIVPQVAYAVMAALFAERDADG